MRVLDLMPEGFEKQYPEGTLTEKGERLLELEIPEDRDDAFYDRVAELTLKGLPRFTTASRGIRRTNRAQRAREAAMAAEATPERTLARRREIFERGGPVARGAVQGLRAFSQFDPTGMAKRIEPEDTIPPAEGFAERAGQLLGSVGGFTAIAAPVGRAAAIAGQAARGGLAARTAGGAIVDAAAKIGARGATMIGAGTAAAVPEGTPRERAIRAGVTAATAGVSHEVGRRVAERFAAPAAKAATQAVTGAAAFGVAQPQVESRILGHEPPGLQETLTAGAELLALNLLLGGRALIPGGRRVGAVPTARAAPEAPPTQEPGAPTLATPEQRTLATRVPTAPEQRGPLALPRPRPAEPDPAIMEAYNQMPEAPAAPILGGRTPRQAFLQLVQERAGTAEEIPAAVAWARHNVEKALELQRHIEPPPVPPGAETLARRAPTLTADLQTTLGEMAGEFSVTLPEVGTVRRAGFIQPLTRVFPWDPRPVRVVVTDRETGQVYPATFRTVDELSAAIQRPQPPAVAPEAQARVEALERNVAAGGPKAAAQGRRLERVREETGIAGRERQEAAMTERERSLAALERQIAERPGDARIRSWRQRASRLRAELMGRAPATQPEPATEPKKEVPGPRSRSLGVTGRTEEAGAPAPAAPAPAAPPSEGPPARSLARSAVTPSPTRTEAAAAPQAADRMIVPNMSFRDEVTAQRVADGIGRSSPGSDPVVVRTRKGFEIEVDASPAESRLKKTPAPQRSLAPPATVAPSLPEQPLPQRGLRAPEPESLPVRFHEERLTEEQRRALTGAATDRFNEWARTHPNATEAEIEAAWNEAQRPTQAEMEARGQSDMFGGATAFGGISASAPKPEVRAAEVPSGEGVAREAAARGEAKPLEVRSQSIHRAAVFQQRETGAAELVRPENIQALLERAEGFSLEEVRKRPILVWRDAQGEVGEAGRLYVIDGHHRLELAQHQWSRREDGVWVKTGQADRDIPAVEIGGDLAYAKEQARVANLAGISNTYTEKSRIVGEMRKQGKTWAEIGAQIDNVGVGKAKAMAAFSELDPGVRERYFPPGKEESLLGGVALGETLGAWVPKDKRVFTPNTQEHWMAEAKNGEWTPQEFQDQIRGWHELLTAAKQEGLGLEGGEIRLVMTPKQFAESVGRIQQRVTETRYVAQRDRAAMARGAERARAQRDIARAETFDKEIAALEQEKERLSQLWGQVKPRMMEAMTREARGEGRFEDALAAIRAEVDQGLAAIPSKGFAHPPGIPLGAFPGNVGEWLYQMFLGPRAEKSPVERRASLAQPYVGDAPPEATQLLLESVKAAPPVRAEQERLRTIETGRRIGRSVEAARQEYGEEARAARFREMAGEYEKLDFEPLRFDKAQRDMLRDAIEKTRRIEEIDKLHAHEGLDKLEAGRVPTDNEIRLLAQIFGEELAVETLKRAGLKDPHLVVKIANLTKSIKSAFDISAPARQGWALTATPEWRRAWRAQMESLVSEEGFRDTMTRIYGDPEYLLARQGKLGLTEPGKFIGEREEAFISDIAERLHEPFEGRGGLAEVAAFPLRKVSEGVRASNRAYSGFLNDLRFGVFKSMLRDARRMGRDPATDQNLVRDICRFINDASGRGELGSLTKSMELLNTAFWSPRFIASRIHILNPFYYTKYTKLGGGLDPFVRKQALRTVLSSASIYATVTGLAALATGTALTFQPRDPDFGKVKIRNTRFDLGGGFLQWIRFGANFIHALRHQDERGYKGRPATKVLTDFAFTKTSPFINFVKEWVAGKDENGKPFDLSKEVVNLFMPMAIEDTIEAAEEYGWEQPEMTVGAFAGSQVGLGVQTYRPRPPKRSVRIAVPQ